jgi:PAS domain S-box-containing protein
VGSETSLTALLARAPRDIVNQVTGPVSMSDAFSPGLLAAIVASSDDAIVSKDLNGFVTSWNRGAERLFGFTAEEMVGQHITKIIPAERQAEEDYVLSRVRAGIGVDHFETIRRRKDGSLVDISLTVSPVRDETGRVVGASKVARDISDRSRMERVTVQLAAIVESSSDAIFATDLHGVIQSWNRAAERMFGWTAREAVGQRLDEVAPLGSSREGEAMLSQVAAGQTVSPFETVLRARDGRLVEASIAMSPIRLRGEVVGISTIARDVSGERQLRLAAEQASRAKDEFLAMLGHELRNPLAPILTALHLMKLKGVAALAPELAMVERQVRHVVSLVDDLLDISRITGGKITLRRRSLDLAAVVDQAVEMASPLFEERAHHLILEVPRDGTLVVNGDHARLAQVVANLLTNAAKYTEPGGRVEVRAGRTGDEVALWVRDNGIGISGLMLPHVFDLFSQERQALDRARGGLGLGLAIVRSIVSLHGGVVEARSEGLGRGAEFEIRLPVHRPAEVERKPEDEPLDVARGAVDRSLRVLVVDDNEDAAEALVNWLDHVGHAARFATDGPTALAATADFTPDVALLDIGLPGMDGYELAQALRQRPGLAELRLVAVTGYGQPADYRRSKTEGFHAHLVKPVDVSTLLRTLETFSQPGDTANSQDR